MDTEEIKSEIGSKIQEFAKNHQWEEIKVLSLRIEEIEKLERRMAGILNSVVNPGQKDPIDVGDNACAWEVTQGDLNQKFLRITHAKRDFGFRDGQTIQIETEFGDKFETQIDLFHNKVHERGAIGNFYRAGNVKEGDEIVLEEIYPGNYTLRRRIAAQ